MDRGAWWAAVHGIAKSWKRLSDFHSQHLARNCYLFLFNNEIVVSFYFICNEIHKMHPNNSSYLS